MRIICKTTLLSDEPPFAGTEVVIRTTAEQLTWGVHTMAFDSGVRSVDVACGDGTTVTVGSGGRFVHTYAEPGTYRVRIPEGIKSFAPSFRTPSVYSETYAPMVRSVRITSPAVRILAAGNYRNCANMSALDLRACEVESIGNEAFRDCGSLASLAGLPASATRIGDLAFASCRGVAGRVDFPNVVAITPTDAEKAPFLGCPGITELHFSASAAEAITSHPLYSVAFGAENAAVFCDL